ncbi:transglycosylase SLT domain-containing protein [Rhodanobacter hydrolyticus]
MNVHLHPKRLLPLIISALLTACATAPAPRPSTTTPAVQPVTAPAPAAAATSAATATQAPSDDDNVWNRLRNSFQMADCDEDPAVLSWAKRYTSNPQRFEQQVQDALPKLIYVQQVASEHGVAGEFAFLPWIESGYRPIPGHNGRPAGMWQIMPATAAAMGLRVNGRYDGRLDVQSTADAVMKLLSRYYDEFRDWRVADYAYNAGEYKARQLVQGHGLPPAAPAIPRWPVHNITREHLTKLLAMACVVRQPGRFNVSLPVLAPSQHLVKVQLPHSMPLARAADKAGMPLDTLKDLNAAFRNDIADASVASYLMMPANHAQQFHDALLAQAMNAGDSTDGGFANSFAAAESGPASSPNATGSRPATHPVTHRVAQGETLWQLAHHYSVSVGDLQQWNHLQGQAIRPGEVLMVSSPQ